jgi:Fe-S-cluster-containing dehydrogenase component
MTARVEDPRAPRRAGTRGEAAAFEASGDAATPSGGVTRRGALQTLAGGSGLLLLSCATPPQTKRRADGYDWTKHRWGYAIDVDKCIGCGSCQRACRAENKVPEGYHRTWVERYRLREKRRLEVDVAAAKEHVFGKASGDVSRAFFVPKMCNHCSGSVCTKVCPVGASFHTKDGVVLVDHDHCIGCGYCVQACPYGCRFINPRMHMADKCTWCYHRITKRGPDGELLQPACVMACPVGARIFGDLKDPHGHLTLLLKRRTYRVLRPALGTDPNCYYHGLEREVL